MRRWCIVGVFVGLTLVAPIVLAQPQSAQSPPAFRASTDLLTIDAVVTDRDGKPVTDLTRDDFDVTIAGKHQALNQVAYIRTQDQSQALAVARSAAVPNNSHTSVNAARSMASQTLKTTGASPERVARTIAIVVDDLGLSFESMHYVRNAIGQYIDTQVEPGDLVAIIRTAGGVGALQQFTTDKRVLHLAADRLRWDFRSRHGVAAFSALTENVPDGLEFQDVDDLHDVASSVGSLAALQYIVDGVRELPGRKCVMYFSEGFASIFEDRMGNSNRRMAGSERIWKAMARMLSRANAAGVVIYTIDARGLQSGGLNAEDNPITFNWGASGGGGGGGTSGAPANTSGGGGATGGTSAGGATAGPASGPPASISPIGGDGSSSDPTDSTKRRRELRDSQESLKFIADQTGGLAIENTNDLNLGIRRVLDDQEGYYLLGYSAPQDAPQTGWDQDRVKVHVKRPGLHVRARQGFFGPFDVKQSNPAPADPLVVSALSPFGSGSIAVRLTSVFGHDEHTGSFIRSLLFIDPADLAFTADQAGKHTARFQVLLMAIGDNGEVLDGWRREVPLALTDQTYGVVKERGIVVTIKTAAKQTGPYQMRAAVEDLASKAVGSASQFLEVPKVGRGSLALSGVLLKGVAGSDSPANEAASHGSKPEGLADTVLFEPEVRVLSPGVDAVYAYEIYDGLSSVDTPLQMSAAVIRDGKVVYQSPFTPVAVSAKTSGKMRAIPIAGTLTLGHDMPPGAYTLEVIVRGRQSKKIERKQWLDFEIRR